MKFLFSVAFSFYFQFVHDNVQLSPDRTILFYKDWHVLVPLFDDHCAFFKLSMSMQILQNTNPVMFAT